MQGNIFILFYYINILLAMARERNSGKGRLGKPEVREGYG